VSLHVAVCSLHVLVVDQNNRIIIVLVFTVSSFTMYSFRIYFKNVS
jgi:hypothetical protein